MNTAAVRELERLTTWTQYQQGLVPEWAGRPMTPAEIRSQVNFASLNRILRDGYGQASAVLVDLRSAVVEDLRNQVSGITDPKKLSKILGDWAITASPGLLAARDSATESLRRVLLATADQAGREVMREASAQGVLVSPSTRVRVRASGRVRAAGRSLGDPALDYLDDTLDDEDEGEDDEALLGEAQSPVAAMVGLLVAAVVAASQRPSSSDAPVKAIEDTSTARAMDLASQGVNIASGEGRSAAAAELPPPANIYASELLDGSTCEPCATIDGTEYDSVEEAEADYPDSGPYIDCDGGARCRGTLVYVYAEDPAGGSQGPVTGPTEGSAPFVPEPADRVPASPNIHPDADLAPKRGGGVEWRNPDGTVHLPRIGELSPFNSDAVFNGTKYVNIPKAAPVVAPKPAVVAPPTKPARTPRAVKPKAEPAEVARLPRLREPEGMTTAAARANPLKETPDGQINCQKAVSTYEARRRGIDVVAAGGSAGTELQGIMKWWRTAAGKPPPQSWAPQFMRTAGPAERAQVMDRIIKEQGPPGSRGGMFVTWEGGGRHIVNWEHQLDGTVKIIDPQINDIVRTAATDINDQQFWRLSIPESVIRLDNLQMISTVPFG